MTVQLLFEITEIDRKMSKQKIRTYYKTTTFKEKYPHYTRILLTNHVVRKRVTRGLFVVVSLPRIKKQCVISILVIFNKCVITGDPHIVRLYGRQKKPYYAKSALCWEILCSKYVKWKANFLKVHFF